jgi:hypothetical protein
MATTQQPVTSSTTLSVTGKPSLTLTGDSAGIQAIVTDAAFPPSPSGSTVIGNFGLTVASGPSVSLPGVNQPVSFQLSASAGATIAQYTDPAKLASDLGFQSATAKPLNITFPTDATKRYMVLECNYALSASGKGQMALAPSVTVSFGADAKSTGEFAFVRAVDITEKAEDACLALLSSWCTPASVANGNVLPYGLWIVTEVNGQLSANLGVQAGYDFNWVKAVRINQLDGDIGLRIALALQANLSASFTGSFIMVLNRETPASGIRLRLFRNTSSTFNFALDANANVTLADPLPDSLDDLIKAIFGIQDAQLLSFLSAQPDATTIANLLGNEFLQKLNLAGTVTQGFTDLNNLLAKWNNLPNAVSTTLWKYAGKISSLAQIQQAATQLSKLSATSITSLLEQYLHDPAYFQGPVGAWLQSAAGSTLFQLYEDAASNQISQIRSIANDALSVLDGDSLQNTLTNLKTQVDKTLALPALQAAVTAGSLAGVAVWVTQRLAGFLGIDLDALTANIAKIDAAIKAITTNADKIYAATRKALNTTYGFSLSAAYTASDMNSAMLDVEFADSARAHLSAAIGGNFGDILRSPAVPGVTINVATFTHGISRDTHLEMHLPWFSSVSGDLASGTVTGKFVDSVDGRVQFYESGTCSDLDSETNTNVLRFATCNVGIAAVAEGIRKYNTQAIDFGYSFITAQPSMTVSQLTYSLNDAVNQYFGSTFGNPNRPSNANFGGWVAALGKFTDPASTVPSSSQIIGPVWANLQVALRATPGSDWLTPLLDGTISPDYFAMSRSMQASIRKWLLVAYSANLNRLGDGGSKNATSAAFLAYTALPPKNDLFLDSDCALVVVNPPKGHILWDYFDTTLVQAVLGAYVLPPLQQRVDSIGVMLSGIPGQKQNAQWYTGQAGNIVNMICNIDKIIQRDDPIMWLLGAESEVIDSARNAFEELRKAGGQGLHQSLPAFIAGLVDLAQTFNSKLAKLSLDAPDIMRLFAPLILQDTIQGGMFGRSAQFGSPDAMIDLAVLKTSTLPTFPAAPGLDDAQIRQCITSFS